MNTKRLLKASVFFLIACGIVGSVILSGWIAIVIPWWAFIGICSVLIAGYCWWLAGD